MNDIVLNKIFSIESELSQHKTPDNFSLFSGLGGYPVFYYLMYELTKNKVFLDKCEFYLKDIFEMINETDSYGFSYCDGLSGIAFMFDFLLQKKILKDKVNDDLKEALMFIDEIVMEYSLKSINGINDIDFLHGAFGASLYLNKRASQYDNHQFNEKLTSVFEKLASIVIEEVDKADKVALLSKSEISSETHKTNCGLAHGYISYIIIFTKFLKDNPDNKLVNLALEKGVKCLLSFQTDNLDSFSQFPSVATNRETANYNIPLGWCYGDQAISLGLYRASEYLNDDKLKTIATDLANKTINRDVVDKIFPIPICDAGFCHGLSSIAYFHKKWFLFTDDKRFEKSYNKFVLHTINNGCNKEGLAGYQKHIGSGKFENNTSLLTGIIGVSIVLMDYLLGDNNTEWDSFFLLD